MEGADGTETQFLLDTNCTLLEEPAVSNKLSSTVTLSKQPLFFERTFCSWF